MENTIKSLIKYEESEMSKDKDIMNVVLNHKRFFMRAFMTVILTYVQKQNIFIKIKYIQYFCCAYNFIFKSIYNIQVMDQLINQYIIFYTLLGLLHTPAITVMLGIHQTLVTKIFSCLLFMEPQWKWELCFRFHCYSTKQVEDVL